MAESTPAAGKMRVKQIYTYPIKSLRGITLPSLPATYTGFPHDRRFVLFNVSAKKHMAVSTYTEMCLFTTSFQQGGDGGQGLGMQNVVVKYTKDHVFNHPDQTVSSEDLVVPLDPDTQSMEEIEVVMHYSPCTGYDMGSHYNEWFSERFGYQVKFLYIGGNSRKCLGNMPPGTSADEALGKPASSSWLGSITSTASSVLKSVTGTDQYDGIDQGIGFADVAPYLVISTKSWENAQERLGGEAMDISKFRPNVIVEGANEAFEEDYWAELAVGETKFVLTNNCARCNSLNVDYETGKVGEGESGKILKKLQSDRRVDLGAKYSPVFGRYGFLARGPEGKDAPEIKVGDEVEVLKRNGEHTRFVWPNLSTDK